MKTFEQYVLLNENNDILIQEGRIYDWLSKIAKFAKPVVLAALKEIAPQILQNLTGVDNLPPDIQSQIIDYIKMNVKKLS